MKKQDLFFRIHNFVLFKNDTCKIYMYAFNFLCKTQSQVNSTELKKYHCQRDQTEFNLFFLPPFPKAELHIVQIKCYKITNLTFINTVCNSMSNLPKHFQMIRNVVIGAVIPDIRLDGHSVRVKLDNILQCSICQSFYLSNRHQYPGIGSRCSIMINHKAHGLAYIKVRYNMYIPSISLRENIHF